MIEPNERCPHCEGEIPKYGRYHGHCSDTCYNAYRNRYFNQLLQIIHTQGYIRQLPSREKYPEYNKGHYIRIGDALFITEKGIRWLDRKNP